MRTTKLRTMISFVIAAHIALVLAAGAGAAKGPDKGNKSTETTTVLPGPHRGG